MTHRQGFMVWKEVQPWFHGLERPIGVASWFGKAYRHGFMVWKDPQPCFHELERPIGVFSCFGTTYSHALMSWKDLQAQLHGLDGPAVLVSCFGRTHSHAFMSWKDSQQCFFWFGKTYTRGPVQQSQKTPYISPKNQFLFCIFCSFFVHVLFIFCFGRFLIDLVFFSF